MKRRQFNTFAALSATVGSVFAADELIKIRLAHSLSTTEPAHLAAEYFAKNVAERTKGRVVINVFPGEQLGSGKEINEMIRQGANVMNITDHGYLSDFVPDIGILAGPYLVKDYLEFNKILASAWYKSVESQLEKTGLKLVMNNGFFGQRHVLANKTVSKPDDMNGMTIRVPPNPMWIETFKAIGARPATIQWSEVYSALEQNVVEAVEAPVGSLFGSKLQEVRKVLSLTGHFTSFTTWPINAAFFNRLPKDVQDILLQEGKRAGDEMTRLTLSSQQSYVDRLKAANVSISTSIDLAAFQKITAPVYKKFPKWSPNLHETVLAIIK